MAHNSPSSSQEVPVRDTISGRLIAQYLMLSYRSVRERPIPSLPPPIDQSALHPRYNIAELDAWLASRERSAGAPPTIAELAAGTVELLKSSEAAALLPWLTVYGLARLYDQRKVDGIMLSANSRRYYKASVLALVPDEVFYTTDEVERVLGIEWRSIRRNFSQSQLQIQPRPGIPNAWHISHTALAGLVGGMLTKGSPDDWIADCLEIPGRLLRQSEAAAYLERSKDEVRDKIKSLPYLLLPGRQELRVPVDGLLRIVEEEPLNNQEVARYFGVAPQTITKWRRAGYLQCTAHYHPRRQDEDDPTGNVPAVTYGACLAKILRNCLSPRVTPRQWMRGIDTMHRPMVTAPEAARQLGTTTEQVVQMALVGELKGVHAPGDTREWRFTQNRLNEFKADKRR